MSVSKTEEKIPVLLLAADHLERWAEALPGWSTDASEEPWYLFLERRYEAEVAIMEQLRRGTPVPAQGLSCADARRSHAGRHLSQYRARSRGRALGVGEAREGAGEPVNPRH